MKHLLPSLLAALLVFASVHDASADEPQPAHRYSDERLPPPSARVNLILTGTLVTAGFYGAGLGASYLFPDALGGDDLRIPIAGPFMAVGRTKMCKNDPNAPGDCNNVMRVIGAVLWTVDGVGQVGGLGLILQSLFLTTAPRSEVSTNEARAAAWRRHYLSQRTHSTSPFTFTKGDFEVTARPASVGGADFGFGLFGTF